MVERIAGTLLGRGDGGTKSPLLPARHGQQTARALETNPGDTPGRSLRDRARSSSRRAVPPTAWKPGRRSSGEDTRGSSPRTKPPPIWAAEPGPGPRSSVAMGTGLEARTEQPATLCSSVWNRATACCWERSRSSYTQSQRSRPGVRTVPRDRRVPGANRGACVPYASPPRSPLRPFDSRPARGSSDMPGTSPYNSPKAT